MWNTSETSQLTKIQSHLGPSCNNPEAIWSLLQHLWSILTLQHLYINKHIYMCIYLYIYIYIYIYICVYDWGYLKTSSNHLGHLGTIFGPSWSHLETNLDQTGHKLGPSRAQLGPSCRSWGSWDKSRDHVGPNWDQVGLSWDQVGPKLGPSWPKLGPSWAKLDTKLHQVGPSWDHLTHLSPSWAKLVPTLLQICPTCPNINSSWTQLSPT